MDLSEKWRAILACYMAGNINAGLNGTVEHDSMTLLSPPMQKDTSFWLNHVKSPCSPGETRNHWIGLRATWNRNPLTFLVAKNHGFPIVIVCYMLFSDLMVKPANSSMCFHRNPFLWWLISVRSL